MKAKLGSVSDSADVSIKVGRSDWIIAGLLIVLTGWITYASEQMIDPVLFQHFTEDVWFGSDVERVISNMSLRHAPNYRAKVHPLFTLLAFPIVKGVRLVTRVSPYAAVSLVIAGTTAIWVGLLFATLRLMGCRRFDAAVFSVLALSSAALIFWTTIPETYLFGSLSLLVCLFVVVLAQIKQLPVWSYILMSLFSLSITTTNWMVGIAATVVNHSRKRSTIITVSVFVIMLLLWGVQSRIFASTTFIADVAEEKNYLFPKTSGGPIRVFLGFFLHPMVVPALQVIPSNRNQPEWPLLSVQHSLPGSGSLAGGIALGLWMFLLGIGAIACWTTQKNLKLRIVVGFGLLGQLALHLIYGEETFLYAIHLIPFLLIVCAMATLTHWRRLSIGIAMLLIVFAAMHNRDQFFQATEFLKNRGPLRQQTPAVRSSVPPASLLGVGFHHPEIRS